MNHKISQNKFVKIFNINIPIESKYIYCEIKNAFLKEDYSLGSEREQYLYRKFFNDCGNKDDLKELYEFCKTTTAKIKRLYKSFTYEEK